MKPFSILYFGNDWSAENRTSSHHIAARLAQRFPLLYVDCPGLRAPQATGRDFKKLFRKLTSSLEAPTRIGEQMWKITLPQVPFRRLPGIALLNRLAGQLLLRRAIRRLGFGRRISWFALPHPGGLAHRLGEEFAVYYCIDNYSALPDVDAVSVQRMDDELTRSADHVFVAAATLLEGKRKLNPHVTHSPHGVDAAHFGAASSPETEIPEAARNLPRPVIGYFGVLNAWIDLPLIAFLARSRPRWTFLLLGHQAQDVSELRALPNVVMTGPQPYAMLPRWAKAFDVAIMPYNEAHPGVKAANPLKLREYLATGRPVVSVPTPEVDKFAHLVNIARNHEDFLRLIEEAMATDTESRRRERMDSVSGSSWEQVAARAADLVERRMRER